jgi:hypothetical protein
VTGRRPWWHVRSEPDIDEDEGEHTPGDGKVLVPTRREYGELDGWVWCSPEDAAAWDVRNWRDAP